MHILLGMILHLHSYEHILSSRLIRMAPTAKYAAAKMLYLTSQLTSLPSFLILNHLSLRRTHLRAYLLLSIQISLFLHQSYMIHTPVYNVLTHHLQSFLRYKSGQHHHNHLLILQNQIYQSTGITFKQKTRSTPCQWWNRTITY